MCQGLPVLLSNLDANGAKLRGQLLPSVKVDVVGERVHRGSHGKGKVVFCEYSHRVASWFVTFLCDGKKVALFG